MARLTRERAVILAGLVLILAYPWGVSAAGQPFLIGLGTRILVMGLAAASLDLIVGFGGMVSFGHAAFFGVGGYVVGILAFHAHDGSDFLGFVPGTNQALVAWPAAFVLAGLTALVIGALSLRTAGVHFIMITLAFAQMIFFLFVSLKTYGGDDGLSFRPRNVLPILDTRDETSFYYVVALLLVGFLVLARRLLDARFGTVLRGVRENERRLAALGIAPYGIKLAAFALSGAVAGLAGALMANQARFVSPELLHWTKSGDLLIMVILGGLGTLYGSVLGAAVLILLETVLAAWTEHWMIVLGPILVALILFARGGLWGVLTGDAPVMTALLEAQGLVKRFGGLVATNDLSLEVRAGECHALIGPNGAGKSTLIAQLAGELRSDAGTIRFAGQDVGRLGMAARARRGLVRSFQITAVLPEFTVLENVALAVQARLGRHFGFWQRAADQRALGDPARRVIEDIGLTARLDRKARELAHGEQRQLELAMALATEPKLLLLDEPMAGMGPEELRRMVQLLLRLKGRVSMLLVEHDMEAVFALADRVTVLVYGGAVATGTPDEIRADPAVVEAYLGTDDGDWDGAA